MRWNFKHTSIASLLCLWFEWIGSKLNTLSPTLDYTTFMFLPCKMDLETSYISLVLDEFEASASQTKCTRVVSKCQRRVGWLASFSRPTHGFFSSPFHEKSSCMHYWPKLGIFLFIKLSILMMLCEVVYC